MNYSLEQTKIAKRYVNSLFSALNEGREADKAAKDITDIGNMIEGSEDLRLFIKTPLLSATQQKAGIKKLSQKAKFSKEVENLLLLLAENRRLQILPAIVHETAAYLAKQSGTIPVTVSTARPLSTADQKKLHAEIKQSLGRDITIESHIDESLIGGLVVQIESTLIDGSLKTKLDRLERELTGAKAA